MDVGALHSRNALAVKNPAAWIRAIAANHAALAVAVAKATAVAVSPIVIATAVAGAHYWTVCSRAFAVPMIVAAAGATVAVQTPVPVINAVLAIDQAVLELVVAAVQIVVANPPAIVAVGLPAATAAAVAVIATIAVVLAVETMLVLVIVACKRPLAAHSNRKSVVGAVVASLVAMYQTRQCARATLLAACKIAVAIGSAAVETAIWLVRCSVGASALAKTLAAAMIIAQHHSAVSVHAVPVVV